jgi:hypothetical protein
MAQDASSLALELSNKISADPSILEKYQLAAKICNVSMVHVME